MSEKRIRINEDIRAPQVRTIDGQGNQIGIISIQDALALAEKQGFDLVEVAPEASPPVCRIMDYGKYRYEQTKKVKEAKKKQHLVKIKEIKVRPNIDKHDFETKLKQGQLFLEKGNKIKITIVFHGREITHTQNGEEILDRFVENLKDFGAIEMKPKLVGKTIVAIIGPTKS